MKKTGKILMELRPALEGFAGIPQETRLLFSSFREFENFETVGLLNHSLKNLSSGFKESKTFKDTTVNKKINTISRHIISYDMDIRKRSLSQRLFKKASSQLDLLRLKRQVALGIAQKISYLDVDGFDDFVWSKLFSKTVPLSEFEKIVSSKFAVLGAPWGTLHKIGARNGIFSPKQYSKIKTNGYDFFVSQTPYPARMTGNTKLVVRYHDAIPIFLPHTIPDTKSHQKTHYFALRDNFKNGATFVCTSNTVRNDLLKIFPNAEKKSTVIHDIVSHSYYPDVVTKEVICEIVKSKIDTSTLPSFFSNREKISFYDKHANPNNFEFLMMVSTLEPRKNHLKLIGAWEMLRLKLNKNLKLIIVGSIGWDSQKIEDAMRPWQDKGQLFHLSKIPSGDLRVLYNNAQAVVCPSVSEGFDLSGIEAMLSGGVVVSSGIPVHKEVYGDASEYFNPYSAKQAADAIEKIIHPDQAEHRQMMIEKGLKHAEQYKKDSIAPKWHNFFDRNM